VVKCLNDLETPFLLGGGRDGLCGAAAVVAGCVFVCVEATVQTRMIALM